MRNLDPGVEDFRCPCMRPLVQARVAACVHRSTMRAAAPDLSHGALSPRSSGPPFKGNVVATLGIDD